MSTSIDRSSVACNVQLKACLNCLGQPFRRHSVLTECSMRIDHGSIADSVGLRPASLPLPCTQLQQLSLCSGLLCNSLHCSSLVRGNLTIHWVVNAFDPAETGCLASLKQGRSTTTRSSYSSFSSEALASGKLPVKGKGPSAGKSVCPGSCALGCSSSRRRLFKRC